MTIDWDSVPFPELERSQIAAICAKHGLGSPVVGRMRSTGVVNSIYTLGNLVLRVPKNMAPALSDTYTESVACPVAWDHGVRTPRLVVWDEDTDILEVPFTIHERVDGVPPELDFDGQLWRDVGRDMARMHIEITDCPDPLGRLDDAGRVSEEGVLTWARGTDVQGWIERCVERLKPLISEPVDDVFLHNDVSNGNVLHKDGAYAAVIDWGDAGWGDPSLEFASLPMVAAIGMLEGYRDVTHLPDVTTEARILWDKIVRCDVQRIRDHMLAFRHTAEGVWADLIPTSPRGNR